MAELKGKVDQLNPDVLTDGADELLRMSKLGQLFTASWHERLIMAGMAYTLDLGAIGATSYTALTGNAALDNDQPEILIAIDSGYLIPMELDIGIVVDDMDAYDDITQIGFVADRTQGEAAGAVATVEVPNNLLDGGPAFSGRAWSIVTTNITTVVDSDWLGGKFWELTLVISESGGGAPHEKSFYKLFPFPTLLKGPCQIVGYVTGTNTPTFMGSVKFAHVPESFFPTS